MDNFKFLELAIREVIKYHNSLACKNGETEDDKFISEDDVYVVWLCKTLQNNKALLSTNVSNGMYYEVTFNGDKRELYFDAYKKVINKCVGGL